jgi:hypothetical protein
MSGYATYRELRIPGVNFAIGLSLKMTTETPRDGATTRNRIIRSGLELVVAIALIVFIFSRPTTGAWMQYFIGSVTIIFLCLSLLRKWP